jgi:sterol 24-C-methyltransferase
MGYRGPMQSPRRALAEKAYRSRTVLQSLRFLWAPFDFPDGHFDAIYHVQVFSLSRDLGALFRDLARLLRPGGTFACLDWVVKGVYDPATRTTPA